LEGDRAAALTLQSAVDGVVDYSKADIRSVAWWQNWRLRLKGVERKNRREVLHNAYEFQLALVSSNRISADDFSKLQRKAKELFEDIDGAYRPWLVRTEAERLKSDTESFKAQWERLSGFKLDDTEAKENWETEVNSILDASSKEFEEAGRKAQEELANFTKVRQEVLNKRLRQQGRR
jgi:hypothetical protein